VTKYLTNPNIYDMIKQDFVTKHFVSTTQVRRVENLLLVRREKGIPPCSRLTSGLVGMTCVVTESKGDKMALQLLENIGLTNKEAELYELLLQLGEVPAQDIIKKSGLKRATAYKVLYSLEQKGLISKKDIKKIIHFRPEPPTELLNMAEAKFKGLERAKSDLKAILPEMLSNYTLTVERPVVTTFEGVGGLKTIYEDTIKEGKPIFAILQVSEIEPDLHEWLEKTYIKQRVKNNIPAKVIVSSGGFASKYVQKDEKALRETRMVSSEKFPFSHEVDIYGDKIAFINYKKGEKLIGVVITHPQISRTMKAWFDLAWAGAERL